MSILSAKMIFSNNFSSELLNICHKVSLYFEYAKSLAYVLSLFFLEFKNIKAKFFKLF